jgi:hypothetical protein
VDPQICPRVTIDPSWAFHHYDDESRVSFDDVREAVDEATLPGDRTIRIEISN